MRPLHVVSVSPDGKSLLLSGTSKNGRATYRVPINARLRAAINGDGTASTGAGSTRSTAETAKAGSTKAAAAPRAESALSPREMQARLRAGATVEAVAKAAGVSVERVETYFGPVLSERIQVLDAAQAATMTRPRWGESARPLGDAVTANLAAMTGLREETVTWSVRRRKDGVWVVRLEFTARGRRRVAEWGWDPRERDVTALDTTATTVGYVEPRGGAARRAPTRTAASRRGVAKKPARTPATRKKPATRKRATPRR